MNLQESIRKILREEVNESTFFRRRVDMRLMEKEFFDILNILTDIYLSKYNHGIDFNFETFEDHVIHYFMDGYYNDLTNGGENDYPYDEVYEYLSNHFHNKIKDRYDTHFGRNINESESKQERKFTKLLNNIQEYLNSNSYDSVVGFMVDYDEVMDDVIVNIFFDAEHAVKLGGGINRVIKSTGKKIMEDLSVFPFDFKYHIHFEKPQLNESKTSQHLKIINNLLEPFKEKDCLCDIRIFFDDEDNYYNIYLVFSQEELHDKFFNLYGMRSYIQKMMNDVKMELESFLPIRNVFIGNYTKPNCEWSPLNESEDDKEKKIQKNLTVLRKLISMFEYSEVCDMWVDYHYEDDDYIIRSKMSTKNHNTAALEKEFEFLEDSIKSLGFTNCYVFRPYYVENCEGENELNESEDDKEKKIQKNLRAIRQLLDTIDVDGLCEMWVEYNPEDGDYEVRSKTMKRYLDMSDMVRELGYIDDTIRSWGMKTYLYTPWYVENCEDEVEFMNESEEKKPKLLSTIEEDGLFQMMQDTGLSLKQIKSKTGELPREVYERYIKDFIKQEGYPGWKNGSVQLIFTVEIQKNIQIDQFYMEGDKVTVEISGYNDYGKQTDGYIESLSNLSDDEIFTIVEDMITWFTSSKM